MTVFGHLISNSTDFYDFIFPFLSLLNTEEIPQTITVKSVEPWPPD